MLSKSVVCPEERGSWCSDSFSKYADLVVRSRETDRRTSRAGKLRPFDVADPSLEVLELGAWTR
jgi:hypothetical protein